MINIMRSDAHRLFFFPRIWADNPWNARSKEETKLHDVIDTDLESDNYPVERLYLSIR